MRRWTSRTTYLSSRSGPRRIYRLNYYPRGYSHRSYNPYPSRLC